MERIRIKPGDSVQILLEAPVASLGLGNEVEVVLSYAEILAKYQKNRSGAQKALPSADRFGKAILYFCTALRRGHWPNGASIRPSEVATTLRAKFSALTEADLRTVPYAARKAMRETLADSHLDPELHATIHQIFCEVRRATGDASQQRSLFAPDELDLV